MRSTHMYVELEISLAAWREIREKLEAAGYQHAFIDHRTIDMYGIAVVPDAEPKSVEQRVAEWVLTRIGEHSMAPPERSMRMFEEATELAHAMGIPIDKLVRQIYHVFARPVGEVLQEAGGVAVCLAGWCAATNTTIEAVLMTELERIEAQSSEEIRGSLARKSDAGLLYESAEEEE